MNALVFRTQITPDHRVRLPDALPVGCLVEITVKTVVPEDGGDEPPEPGLGKRLLAIRQRAIAKGMKLQTVDEILQEVRQDSGEAGND